MIIFPAIDIRGGKVVRLTKGDYDDMTVYGDDPVLTAFSFRDSGADHLHVVDLDGAREGETVNFGVIKRIVAESGMFVQVGGGIRDMERADRYAECGVGRMILGTAAVEDPDFLRAAIKKYRGKIAVGADARDGKIAVRGWEKLSGTDAFDFCTAMRDLGVGTVIYTDISRDGAMSGTNIGAYRRLAGIDGLDIIASGGITYYSEIAELRDMGNYGAILGKALYTGALDLKTAIETARGG